MSIKKSLCSSLGCFLVGLGCWPSSMALAQPAAPRTEELQVNQTTAGNQFLSATAMQADGSFVVVWMSTSTPGDDTSQYALVGRRFDAAGGPQGGDFQVNGYTTGDQKWPAVASLPGGGFVVVWASVGSSGDDASGDSVQLRRFAADGQPIGDDFQVNTTVSGDQSYPVVAVAADDSFVVAWQSSAGEDGAGYGVLRRRFDAGGMAIGGELVINTYTTGNQTKPALAMRDGGDFVVVWESSASPVDLSMLGVRGRRFAADATPLGEELQINTYTSGNQLAPRVGLADHGAFNVVWESHDAPGDPGSRSIQGRRFTAEDLPRSNDEQINIFTSGPQTFPRLATEGDGSFVVVWESLQSPGDDPDRSIQGQRHDHNGKRTGDDFQVNQYTTSAQFLPVLAGRDGGDFVVGWISYGSTGDDTSSTSIAGRLYGRDSDGDGVLDEDDLCVGDDASGDFDGDLVCADLDCADGDGLIGLPDACGVCGGGDACIVFGDGFESGDTAAWSSTLGTP